MVGASFSACVCVRERERERNNHLADPEFLSVTPLLLRLLELVLTVGEAGFLVGCPGCGGG